MILLNFSHPLTAEQIRQIEALTGQTPERILHLPAAFDPQQPFEPQLQDLFSQLPLPPQELETAPLLVVLPSLNYIAALVLAELHGRIGHFPAALRLRPEQIGGLTTYAAAEILNLQALREAARGRRAGGQP